MSKLKIYKISDNYIEYLRQFDDTISLNKDNKRPYIGVVLVINDFNYFAPLTSPKKKHRTMKNTIDFMKIAEGRYGAINLNNMIPVIESELIKIDINNIEDIEYRNLLQNQYRYLKGKKDKIKENAEKLYEKVVVKKVKVFTERCSKFAELESKCILFKAESTVVAEVAIDKE